METLFAPAQRADRKTLNTQIQSLSHNPVMNTLLDIVSGLLVVLNENRQVVAFNSAFLTAAHISDPESTLGMRLGETLSCIHAHEDSTGCGTTAHCVTCGAAIAIMAAINDNQSREEICALTSDRDGAVNDISLLIKAKPVTIDGFRWILIFARDITRQQFWVNLERVFFHDISNILSSLHGNASFLAEDLPGNKYAGQILNTTERLWNELLFQKSLSRHKDARYLLKKTQTGLDDIQREFNLIVSAHPSATNKSIRQDWPDGGVSLFTDALLVSRILGNMAINALEATPENGFIKVSAHILPQMIRWDIWSDSVIPEDIQLRIFQRHFSTKASVGRGLGTYSMKLFGETYLKGSVFFTSSKAKGTTFSFSLPY